MRILLAALFALATLPALAQSPGAAPVIRMTANPPEGIVIGQPVALNVAVLFPGEMAHPPLVRIPEAAGAQIMRFETQATTIRDSIDGREFLGQTFSFVLFPRRGGQIEIPPPQVTLLDRSGDPVSSAQGPALRLAVTVPQGVDPSRPVLVADRVEVTQRWTPDPATARLKPGDAIVRTIERRAEGVPALGMAELRFSAPEGVRVYAAAPVVDDSSNRGSVTGHRIDKVTYVFERAGLFELPELHQQWLTLPGKQVRDEVLPGASLTISAAGTAHAAASRSFPWALVLGASLALLIAAWLGRLAWTAWRSARERDRASAEHDRRELIKIARAGEPRATYRALARWRQRLSPDECVELMRQKPLASLMERLERSVFGLDGEWTVQDSVLLSRALAGARLGQAVAPSADRLPPLNPSPKPHG